MFRRGLSWLPLAWAPALAACSLLLGEGFTDPGGEPSQGDSGTPATDAPANGGDASTDGETAGDATSEDTGTPPSDAGLFCPDAAVSICDDFERSDPKGSLWPSTNLAAGGELVIETTPSGNRQLRSKITNNGDQAQVWRELALTPARFHLEVSVELSAYGSGAVYIVGMGMPNGVLPPSLVYLYSEISGVWIVQQVTDGQAYHRDQVPLAVGTKHRVVVDLEFGGAIAVTVDGTKVIDAKAQTFLVPKPPTVHVGASSIDDVGSGVTLKIDDFVFTAD